MLDLNIFKRVEGTYNPYRRMINIINLLPYIDAYLEDGTETTFTKEEMQQLATYYMGQCNVYEENQEKPDYFYIENISGETFTMYLCPPNNGHYLILLNIDLEMSTDGENWLPINFHDGIDGKIQIPANGKLYIRGDNETFSTGPETDSGGFFSLCFNEMIPHPFNIGGNLLSLFSREMDENIQIGSYALRYFCEDCQSYLKSISNLKFPQTVGNYCYQNMFSGCTQLTTAPELPATTLADYCYDSMFSGCTSLINAPELPATVLAWGCYSGMFSGCTSLINAPELPATVLVEDCYGGMFYECTSLTTAPKLPATTLAGSCYGGMFSGCTSLITPPELPATALAPRCYSDMFPGCASLINAPELPATVLANYCYFSMFSSCTSLNKIITHAQDISAKKCLYNWVSGVNATGDFYNLGGATYPTGTSGIPFGWTVHTTLE